MEVGETSRSTLLINASLLQEVIHHSMNVPQQPPLPHALSFLSTACGWQALLHVVKEEPFCKRLYHL